WIRGANFSWGAGGGGGFAGIARCNGGEEVGACLAYRVDAVGRRRAARDEAPTAVPCQAAVARPDHVHVVLARAVRLNRACRRLGGARGGIRAQVDGEPKVRVADFVECEADEGRR